ncbi:hypothetical protein [Photobacterium sp.]|uniref:hypothetical protein n=1 Tax=Photobacterium sp. TaxID=660 RepID=UPI00299CF03F|nr:hypothetical protein [Photobacterium sp.]MDX1301214.1 hypothetical protein [Photobacterium sp.]
MDEKITKEQWVAIEKELSLLIASVHFNLDGHEISVGRRLVREGVTSLFVYIDGEIKGGWYVNKFGIRPAVVEKVWRKRSQACYSPSKIQRIEKLHGKRNAKKYYPELHKKHEYLDPEFTKASVLVRQFKKLDGLTLVKASCLEAANG